jgi:hypothetical protein
VTDIPEAALAFLDHLGQHIGVLAVEFVHLDKIGQLTGAPEMRSCSGFFIVLDGQWYFVTAGHVFERSDRMVGLKQAVDAKAIRITRAFIADYFGPRARHHGSGPGRIPLPTLVDFDEVLANARFLNDDRRGLDFSFVPLRELYVAGIAANGVTPLSEDMWHPDGEPDRYMLVGFPDEEKSPSPTDSSEEADIRLCSLQMNQCDLPAHLAKPISPFLAVQMPDVDIASPVGFSGAPIFAVRFDEATGNLYYWLVAIDHKWYPDEKIIVGCMMTSVVAEFRAMLCAEEGNHP